MNKKELLQKLDEPTSGSEIICAIPYGYGLPHFYFSDFEQYERKLKIAQQIDLMVNLCGDFEHSLEVIEFDVGGEWLLDKVSVEEYFDLIYEPEEKLAKLHYLMTDLGYDYSSAIDKVDDVALTTESVDDYVMDFANERLQIPENIKPYFDYQAFQESMESNGEICETSFNGTDYLVTNCDSL